MNKLGDTVIAKPRIELIRHECEESMKIPDAKTAQRCMEIRKRSKLGEHVAREDSEFCYSCYEKYPAWYKSTEAAVFRSTAPFGAKV